MIDVVIYGDPEDMSMSDADLATDAHKSLTSIRSALMALGYKEVGLVSLRAKNHNVEEYTQMVVDR
jgi:hypothetical protein